MATPAAPFVLLDEAKQTLEQLWNLGTGCEFKGIKQSENHTYLVAKQDGGSKFILRLTPIDHRTQVSVQAELDYILLLASTSSNLHVCKPLPLATTGYIATGIKPYADKHDYYASLFEFAKGADILGMQGLSNDSIVAAYGRTLALMHQGISKKGNNAEQWDKLCKQIPLCSETHNGATNIETLRARANNGHKTSQLLLRIWDEKIGPFLESLGAPNADVYGPIHGDFNVSNFLVQQGETSETTDFYVFDFDQVQMNWLGFDIGVVLKMVHFFEENKWFPNFSAAHFTKVFMAEYEKYAPEGIIKAGHTTPAMLQNWIDYREFYHTGVAVDILFQVENGKQFEANIVNFCKLTAGLLEKKYAAQ